ncbi:MAG: efflux RND transporter periplasmic adaptor subunit [Verrucomicrobia bacterium]|nr:efflux RND transporter periplasmic adaptor subunit [Verrucomicrobiota bacterium]
MLPVPAVPKSAATQATVRPPKKSKAVWYVLGGLVLAGAVGYGFYFQKKRAAEIVTVTTEKAVVKTIVQIVSATGKIQPEVEVKIAPEVSGEVTQLGFREGAEVKKGDLLLSIKPDFYQAQVEQQEANLVAAKAMALQAKAQLLKAQDDLKRSEDLFAKKLISDSDIGAARTALEVAQANLENGEAQIRRTEGSLNQARDSLTKTKIYAPIDGKVSSLSTEVGERVAGTGSYGGAEVMRVADLANMEVRVNINENDIVNVKVGDKAKVSIDAFPNRKFDAVVKEIGSAARISGQYTQDEVTNFLVKIRVLDKDVPLRPGMSANADVETKTVENVIAVPIQSVTVRSREGTKTIEQLATEREKKANETKGEGAATAVSDTQRRLADRADRESLQRVVFARTSDTVKMVKVETGIQDTTHIEIKSGLKAGDEVVSGSFGVITRTLKDGSKVKLEKPKKDAKK